MAKISKEYAAAIFELAKERNSESEFRAAIRKMQNEFDAAPEYTELLSSPGIPFDERCKLLEQAFENHVPEYVLSLAELMCNKGYIKLFGEFAKEYENLYCASRRESYARVVSAVELSNDEKARLIKKLEEISGCAVNVQYEIDVSLIGGAVIYIDDRIIDGSLRAKIKDIKEVIGT